MEKWKKWKKKDSLSNKLCLTLKTSMDKTKKTNKTASYKNKWAIEQIIYKRRLMNGPQAYGNVLNISHSENSNSNHQITRLLKSKCLMMPCVGKDVEQIELSEISDQNAQ